MKLILDRSPIIYIHAELESNAYLNTDKLEQILATHNNIEECVIYNLKEEIVWRINSDIFRQYPHIHFRIEDNMFRDLGHALPDNVVHFKHPFYFLYHTMTHGMEYDANIGIEDTSFCFLNNVPRPYRVKLWDKLTEEHLLNEYCSFLTRRVFTDTECLRSEWFTKGHHISMNPPQFYDKVGADVFVETETDTLRYTEKTWKPLFHEKICLGFGGAGYYTELSGMGFELHKDFIDYSFDTIADSDERFEAYYEQVKRVISYPLGELLNATESQREHNRRNCLQILLEIATVPDIPTVEPEVFFNLCKTQAWEILNLGDTLTEKEREEQWYSE